MKTIDIIALIILTLTWGTVYTVAGYTISFFPAIFLYSLRFLIAGICLLPFCKVPNIATKEIILFGVLQAFTFLGIAIALKHIDSSISAIIMRLDIPIIILIANFMFNEKISIHLIFGILLCFVAVYIIAGGIKEKSDLFYLFVIILSAILSAFSHIVSKTIGDKNIDNKTITCYSSFIIFILLFIFSILFREDILFSLVNADIKAWLLLFYLGIGPSLIGYICLHFIMRRNPTTKTMPAGFLRPFISTFSAFLVLNEPLNPEKIFGMLLIVIGVYISENGLFFLKK